MLSPTNDSSPSSPVCRHCGTPFVAREGDEGFCCRGCAFVWQMIRQEGLDRYYELRQGPAQPVLSVPFNPHDFSALQEWQERLEAEAAARDQREVSGTVRLGGISCIGCVWLIERLFRDAPGGISIQASVEKGSARMAWSRGAFDIQALARQLQRFGYLASPFAADSAPAATRQSEVLSTRLGLSGALALNTMLFTLPGYLGMQKTDPLNGLFITLTAVFATASLIFCGSWFVFRAAAALRRGVLSIDLPISLGLAAAWTASFAGLFLETDSLVYFDFVSVFTFLMLLGRWIQERAVEANRARSQAGQAVLDRVQRLTPEGRVERIPATDVRPGDVLLIPKGEFLPVSLMLSAPATLSLEWIRGESDPVACSKGGIAPSGALNCGQSDVCGEALESGTESLVHRLLAAVPVDPLDTLANRVLRVYMAVVIVIAFAGLALWFASSPSKALQVFISALIVSCPCALGVALPLAHDTALSALRRVGVFVRKGDLWMKLRRVKSVVFDKTGTLTFEVPRLVNPDLLLSLPDEARQALGHLVRESLHPVSRALRQELATRFPLLEVSRGYAVEEHPGYGLSMVINGTVWSLGRPGWSPDSGASSSASETSDCELRRQGTLVAGFTFQESVRDDALAAIQRLRGFVTSVVILSGDRREKVLRMAHQLDIKPEYALGELTPSAKAEWIQRHAPQEALMIGDGLNDSLAFQSAACCGTPVFDKGLLEPRSDFFFTDRGLDGICALFRAERHHRKVVRQVFAFALAYNATVITVSLCGGMSPLLASILMPASSLATVWIATRRLELREG